MSEKYHRLTFLNFFFQPPPTPNKNYIKQNSKRKNLR